LEKWWGAAYRFIESAVDLTRRERSLLESARQRLTNAVAYSCLRN